MVTQVVPEASAKAQPLQQPSDETQLMAEGATSDQVLVERVL